MIYLLYGQPGSGKSSLGKLLARDIDTFYHIDGDTFRQMLSNQDYSKEGRTQNLRCANAVATYLNKTGEDIVMSFVHPYEHLRDELRNANKKDVVEIYLNTSRDLRKDKHVTDFEVGCPDIECNTNTPIAETFLILNSLIDHHISINNG